MKYKKQYLKPHGFPVRFFVVSCREKYQKFYQGMTNFSLSYFYTVNDTK